MSLYSALVFLSVAFLNFLFPVNGIFSALKKYPQHSALLPCTESTLLFFPFSLPTPSAVPFSPHLSVSVIMTFTCLLLIASLVYFSCFFFPLALGFFL